jgi:hypothetical protein
MVDAGSGQRHPGRLHAQHITHGRLTPQNTEPARDEHPHQRSVPTPGIANPPSWAGPRRSSQAVALAERLLGDLRRALDAADQLTLHYQPKVSLNFGELCGVEALIRWHHPTRGMISPADFIPVAETTGLINRLTVYVLRLAVAQARAWLDQGLAVPVAVPSTREIDTATMAAATVFADSAPSMALESGDYLFAAAEATVEIRASIGDVIAGRAAGRTRPEEITLFKSIGLAVEDLFAAQRAYTLAQQRGAGTRVAL